MQLPPPQLSKLHLRRCQLPSAQERTEPTAARLRQRRCHGALQSDGVGLKELARVPLPALQPSAFAALLTAAGATVRRAVRIRLARGAVKRWRDAAWSSASRAIGLRAIATTATDRIALRGRRMCYRLSTLNQQPACVRFCGATVRCHLVGCLTSIWFVCNCHYRKRSAARVDCGTAHCPLRLSAASRL